MNWTPEDLDMIKKIVEEAVKEHVCHIDAEAAALLNNEVNREVLRTLGKGMTPNSASVLARVARTLDKVSFDLGALLLRFIILGGIGIIVWMFFKRAKGEL